MSRRQKHPLRKLQKDERLWLNKIARSASEPASHVARAKQLLAVADGGSYTAAAQISGRKSGDAAFRGQGQRTAEQQEIYELRQKVNQLEEERAILKNVWLRRRSQAQIVTSGTRRDGCNKCIRLLLDEGFSFEP